ncbi:MAG: lysylphosphatidylglycerol synthase transmembrane domain-containing protein [Thermoguttaceae bacterium]
MRAQVPMLARQCGEHHGIPPSPCWRKMLESDARRHATAGSSRRRWLTTALKVAIVLIMLWFIRGRIVEWWQQLGQHRFRVDYGWLAVSGVLYLLGSLMSGLFWHRTLRTLGQEVSLGHALKAYYIGHLGKYVPGKAMVVVLRAGLIRGPGVEASLAVISVFFETLTMMAVGACLAAAIVAGYVRENERWFWASVLMMLSAGLPTLPPVAKRLARILTAGRLTPTARVKLDQLGGRTVVLGWALNLLGWALLGLSVWAVLRALGTGNPNPLAELQFCTAAIALATVAGFLSFVPGGAVVREAVLAETIALLMPYIGGTPALVASVLLRLVWLLSELVISGILYLLGGKITAGNPES